MRETRERRLNDELDQFDAELREVETQVAIEVIVLDDAPKEDIRRARERLDAAREKCRQIEAAREEARAELEASFREHMDDLGETWRRARARVEEARATAARARLAQSGLRGRSPTAGG
jgi:uncharacterized protein (DUF3084 family)